MTTTPITPDPTVLTTAINTATTSLTHALNELDQATFTTLHDRVGAVAAATYALAVLREVRPPEPTILERLRERHTSVASPATDRP